MDGALGDRVVQDRLHRLVTLSYASDNFPRLIYRLKQRRLKLLKSTILSGKKVFHLQDLINKHEKWIILETDFDRCKEIAENVKIRGFPSDSQRIVEENIRVLVRVSFSDRSF
jgi:hypothetical protein